MFASQASNSMHAAESKDVKIRSKIREARKLRFGAPEQEGYRYGWCAIRGDKIDVQDLDSKELSDNDPERLTCDFLIASGHGCWVMKAIGKILNDVHSPRNMVFCKGKYGGGMDARKISVEWTEKDGYIVFVDERW